MIRARKEERKPRGTYPFGKGLWEMEEAQGSYCRERCERSTLKHLGRCPPAQLPRVLGPGTKSSSINVISMRNWRAQAFCLLYVPVCRGLLVHSTQLGHPPCCSAGDSPFKRNQQNRPAVAKASGTKLRPPLRVVKNPNSTQRKARIISSYSPNQ